MFAKWKIFIMLIQKHCTAEPPGNSMPQKIDIWIMIIDLWNGNIGSISDMRVNHI